ncbi:DNA polymerase [Planctomycetales bacterium]|nr:DNA polymerase [Planctomycetales bacterium]
MSDTLYLIDTHAFIYRAFYALENLRAPDGAPVNAIFQFARMLANLLRDHRPQHLVAVFDAPGKNFRHELFPDYKATRRETPPELRAQINPIRDLIKLYAIQTLSAAGYEADDVIGALARQAEAAEMNVVIISGDKDLAQLLTDRVSLFDPQKEIFITAADYEAKNGFPPARLPDLFGLWGDKADNIPGVAGIGEKIGRELICQYGSLENLLDHAADLKGKRGEVLQHSRDAALLSKNLATIRTDAPVVFNKDDAVIGSPDWAELRLVFTRYGFNSLLQDLQFAAPETLVEIVNTPEKFAEFYHALAAADVAAVAVAPTGVAFSWQNAAAYYLPNDKLDEPPFAKIKDRLADENFPKYFYDYKENLVAWRRRGGDLRGAVFDALLAGHWLAAHLGDHTLDALALRYLGVARRSEETVTGAGARRVDFAQAEPAKVAAYFGETAALTWRLFATLDEKLSDAERKYLREIELPLSEVLAAMQERGVRVNAEVLQNLGEELAGIIDNLRAGIVALAGEDFNLESPRQLGEIMFDKLKMPTLRRTKTGFSTDEATLKELAAQGYELPALMLDYRQYYKLKNTYIDALPPLLDPRGRVHTTFSQTSTATGRLASHRPNLQNIPVRSEKGRAIRAAFVAPDGWQLLAADYSQIELRVLAHFSGDENLLAAFANDRDIHRAVAAAVNRLPENEVSADQRRAAKAVNFGIIYGQSAHGLAEALGIPHFAAQDFIDQYFRDFPAVKSYLDATLAQAAADGFVKTLYGRRREIPELRSSKKTERERGEREAVNTVIQGTAAEIIKVAMLRLARRLHAENFAARMLLQIHDELVLEAPLDEVPRVAALVKEVMESAADLIVPLKVEIGVGDNWLAAK